MTNSVNQLKAALKLSKYSLLATLRSPTSIVFSLLFPIIFITVFGSIIGGQAPELKLAIAKDCDTGKVAFKLIRSIPSISFQKEVSTAQQAEDLKKGRIDAILEIKPQDRTAAVPYQTIHLQEATSAGQKSKLLETLINEAISKANQKLFPANKTFATLAVTKVPGSIYRSIDFILPGQLGFSLLMAGVYGSSFLLFSLRKNLVLKRLQATPVKRGSIITGEMLSRLFFHIISFIIMVAIGYYAFSFTLQNGIATFIQMLVFSFVRIGNFHGDWLYHKRCSSK